MDSYPLLVQSSLARKGGVFRKPEFEKTPYSKTTFNLALHLVWGIAQNMIQTDEEQDSILLS